MTTRFIRIAAATALAALALPALADAALDRGAYLARIMDCGGCHTPTGPDMAPDETRFLAGGAFGFGLPGLGVFYPPNLTPDMETGLGAWSAAEIVAALGAQAAAGTAPFVRINADARAPVSGFLPLVAALEARGVTRIALVVTPPAP